MWHDVAVSVDNAADGGTRWPQHALIILAIVADHHVIGRHVVYVRHGDRSNTMLILLRVLVESALFIVPSWVVRVVGLLLILFCLFLDIFQLGQVLLLFGDHSCRVNICFETLRFLLLVQKVTTS